MITLFRRALWACGFLPWLWLALCSSAFAQVMNNTDLAVGGASYLVENASKAWSLTQPSAGTLRFELKAGDTWPNDPATKNRSEISGLTHYAPGQEIDVGYTQTFEAGAPNSAPWLVSSQFHQVENNGYSPPFEENFNGSDRMGFAVNFLTSSGGQAYKQVWTDSAPITRGHAYVMQVKARFDTGEGTGHLVVIRDGVTLFTYSGPMGFPGMSGVYWKEGLYRYVSSVDEAVDYAGLTISVVAPTPPPAPAPPVGTLPFAPPAMVNPVTIAITPGAVVASPTGHPDCILSWPKAKHVGRVQIFNCHNVVSIGGWNTVPQPADLSNSPPSRILEISGATGVVHIEGLLGDASAGGMSDGIDLNDPQAVVQIENVRLDGIFGYSDQFHADCIQPFGGVKALKVYNFTCNTGFQGLSLWPVAATPDGATISLQNVNVTSIGPVIFGAHNDGGYLYWPCAVANAPCSKVPTTTLANVYLTPRATRPFSSTVFTTDPTQQTPAAVVSDDGNSISFPGLPITGSVQLGPPSGGDYVPAGVAGVGYASPGYSVAAASVPTQNAAYVGNGLANLASFEAWLGKRLDGVQIGGGRGAGFGLTGRSGARADYTGSLVWATTAPQIGAQTGRVPEFTLPMFIAPADEDPGTVGGLTQAQRQAQDTLAAVAAGAYDALWTQNAQRIAAVYPSGQIRIRMGEEFNGDWMPWAATPSTAAQFVAAWRRMQSVIKGVLGSRAVFEWCPNVGQNGAGWDYDWSLAYPGDDVVDVAGLDIYWDTTGGYQSADPTTAFAAFRDATNGLSKFVAFAAAHGKPTAYHEWGQHQDGAWPTLMAAWFALHPPQYQGFWDQPATPYQISNDQHPVAAAAYLAAFGAAANSNLGAANDNSPLVAKPALAAGAAPGGQ